MLTKPRNKKNCRRTRQTENIAKILSEAMPEAEVDAYRYSPVAIRMRVVSDRFEQLTFFERNAYVRTLLDSLSERDQSNLLLPFVFTPAEIAAGKPLNYEYEHPTSQL